MSNSNTCFEILLKNEKATPYDRIALLFTFLNLVFLLYLTFTTESIFQKATGGICSVLLAILLAVWFFSPLKNGKNKTWILWTAGIIICVSWMLLEQWWLMIFSSGIIGLYVISSRKLVLVVSKESIIYPSFPKKIIAWSELQNVILKDGLLTLNFKSDRFIQQVIDSSANNTNEKEFNEFCSQQVRI